MKNILDWIEENKQQFEGQEPRTMDQAALVDELEPGALKDELVKDFDPSQETYEEYLQRKRLGERPFNMAEGGRTGFKDGNGVYDEDTEKNLLGKRVNELMDEGYEFGEAVRQAMKEGYAKGGRAGYNDGQLVTPSVDGSRPGYQGPGGGKPGRSIKIIDKELLQTIVDEANLSDEWFSGEDISKLYAEATGDTNVTKRKVKDKIVTYKKLDSYTIKNTGLLSKEKKIERVFNDLLAMDGPVPEVDLGKYKNRNISNYKKYIMSKTGLGTNFVDQTVNNLPTFKKYEKAFKYLWTSGLAKTELANMSLTEQLNWAIDAGKGKPVFTGVSKLNIEDPTFTLMRIAKENWNKNKGAGNIQFYDKNGKKITWKHGLKMNINNVSFSKDKSKKRFTLGNKKGTINVRLEGEKYFPEVFENQRYINELKSTLVDNPFKPGKKIEFGKLMRKVYMQGHGWKPHAPLFSIFHGPKGIAKEPFKNLSFGMQDLNRALYHMDNIPLKGLKQKVINQALVGLKGKKGQKLLEAIIAKHSDHASQVAAGKKFDKPLRIQVLEEVAKTGDLGPKEMKVVKNILDNSWCPTGKAYGGRIGFANGSGCPDSVKQKNFLKMTNDVGKGRITGEAAEQIAKNAAKVVARAGSKSALASILGPAGIGIDLAYEVGSIGFDMAMDSNVSLKQALQNNWLTGAFIEGTGQEEYNKGLVNFDSSAKPMATIQNLIEKIEREEKNLERMETSLVRGDYTGEAKKELLAKQEALIKNLYNDFDKVARKKATSPGHPEGEQVKYLALEEGSPERIAFDRAKQEYDSIGEAKALLKRKSKHGFEESLKTSRAEPWIDFGLSINPKYGKYSKRELDKRLKEFGDYFGYGWTPYGLGYGMQQMQPGIGDMKYNEDLGYREMADALMMNEAWDNLSKGAPNMADGGRAGYMGGGITGIRKPSSIPPKSGPMSEGLRSLYNNGRKW